MALDNEIPAAVTLQRQQLREKAGREEIRISAPSLMRGSGDFLRRAEPCFRDALHGVPPQKRLIGDKIQNSVARPHGLRPEADGVAQAPVRMRVVDGGEAVFSGQLLDPFILRHDADGGEHPLRDGVQRAFNERPPVKLCGELVRAEAAGVSGGHDQTADAERCSRIHGIPPNSTQHFLQNSIARFYGKSQETAGMFDSSEKTVIYKLESRFCFPRTDGDAIIITNTEWFLREKQVKPTKSSLHR